MDGIRRATVAPLLLAGIFASLLFTASAAADSPNNGSAPPLGESVFDIREFNLRPTPQATPDSAPPPPNCEGGICPGIGNAFFLPDRNVLGPLTGGSVIFGDRNLNSCVSYSPLSRTNRSFLYSKSTKDFYTTTSRQFGLSGGLETLTYLLGITFETTTGYSRHETTNIQTSVLDVSNYEGALTFRLHSDCLGESNLNREFREAFQSLPAVNNAAEFASWKPYRDFLQTWGSHVMVEEYRGSRYQRSVSALTSEEATEDDLQARACLSVEGMGSSGTGWSVGACADYTDEEKKASTKYKVKLSEVVIGGSPEARADLIDGVNRETLNRFFRSADQADEAAEHHWMPIWQILSRIYGTSQTTINLEAAFEGWMGVTCPKIVKTKKVGDEFQSFTLQEMRVASTDAGTGFKTYGCWTKKEGCYFDSDCQIGGSGTVCYCYGNGCVEKDKSMPIGDPADPSGFRDKIRTGQTGSYSQGVNNSCKFGFFTCDCDEDWQQGLGDRYLWRQE